MAMHQIHSSLPLASLKMAYLHILQLIWLWTQVLCHQLKQLSHPRLPNMTIPKGYTILPKSDEKWVVFSPNWDSRLTSFVSNDHLVIFMSSHCTWYIYKHLIWPSFIDIFNLPLKMALATGIILNMHCCL